MLCESPSFLLKTLPSFLFPTFRHVANGEILGVALLMDDVLQTGVQYITVLTDRSTGEGVQGQRNLTPLSHSYFRHVANGEILGVALLMDDVLQTGVQDITVLTDRPTEGDKKGDKKGKAGSEKRASSAAGNSKMGMCMLFSSHEPLGSQGELIGWP